MRQALCTVREEARTFSTDWIGCGLKIVREVRSEEATFDFARAEIRKTVSVEPTNESGPSEADEPADQPEGSGLRSLVLQAFAKAAEQDRPEWFRMHGTVLKNRLLDLTNRTFSEADYGADRFGDLVRTLPDVLDVDEEAKPFVAELREPHRSEVLGSIASGTGEWIRSDLWNAMLDYSSPGQWLWSPTAESTFKSGVGDRPDDCIPLPTLDPELLGQWRTEFANALQQRLDDDERRRVEEWSSLGLRATALPRRVVHEWNELVRQRVRERLVEFFDLQGLEQPRDLDVSRPARQSRNQLRAFVQQCIGLMSDAELREISIPVHSLASSA